MKAIEGMQPQINDMERRLGIMQSVEPVLENAIKTLQKVVDVRGMGKSAALQLADDDTVAPDEMDPYKQARFETQKEGKKVWEKSLKTQEKAFQDFHWRKDAVSRNKQFYD